MATLSTCNRNFLQRIKLLESVKKMIKQGKEKERKKEKFGQVTGKTILFGS